MKIFGTHDQNTIDQLAALETGALVRKSALMADGHYGYVMPVGGVVAYDNAVSVNGVGFDIACGNCAIKTNIKIDDVMGVSIIDIEQNPLLVYNSPELGKIADQIAKAISFGIGRSNVAKDAPTDHTLFSDVAWNIIPNTGGGQLRDMLRSKARQQLGTVGSGNHYVDVFVDLNDGYLWVGVHFGSRGFGHTIASNFLAIGQGGSWGDKSKESETVLTLGTPAGDDYWALMNLCGQYAYAGREWVTRTVVSIVGGAEVDMVHNHHNFAWKEIHKTACSIGESFNKPLMNYTEDEFVVVRKGATPAFPGQRGFVGGSMGDNAVILKGTDLSGTLTDDKFETADLQIDAMFSTVHGAGRVMSRTEAAGKRDRKTGELKKDKITGEVLKPGKVSPQMMETWLREKGVVLRGGGLDESPHAYRRLPDVLSAQGDTITVLNTLRPLIVVMAGADEIDPYQD